MGLYKNMKAIKRNYNLISLSKKYQNKWVALSKDHKKVIGVGNKLKDVSLKSKGKDVVFLKLLSNNSFYMPQAL